MKQFFLSLLVGFALMNLTAQSYIDINFAEANGVNVETIQVTNLSKGASVTLQGTDILRLNSLTTGLQSISVLDNELLIYPNPIEQDGFFCFVNPNQGRVEIRLHNLEGKTIHSNIYELASGKHTFSISGVPNGIHLLSIITQAGSFSGRITSSENKSAQIKTALIDQKSIDMHSSIPTISRISSIHERMVELSYTPGDNLYFQASSQGYVSQGMYASPTNNQTITFFLTEIRDVFNPVTGMTWMDRNLGARRAAISSSDTLAYGDLYQWGRRTDGHEKRTSQTTSTLISSDTPDHNKFVTINTIPHDWRSPEKNNLWQGVNGINNPCPEGYRIPTIAEWHVERLSWSSNNSEGAIVSPLKLPMPGFRHYSGGPLRALGTYGLYWSSTVAEMRAESMDFNSGNAYLYSNSGRATGGSVRCIKNIASLILTTTAVTEISSTSSSSGGVISSDGGDAIKSRGVVWSTSQNPTIELSTKTSNGSGIGSFTSSITGLSPFTTYYVRAYATNNAGTTYGNEVIFSTLKDGEVQNPATGRIWMDRNLGASRVATSSFDTQAYGDLYQWGRGADGHQKRYSQTTSTLSSSNTPGHNMFITVSSGNIDWRSQQNNSLWQGIKGINNPCPEGFRIPTMAEWNSERASWSNPYLPGAFASPLKLPAAGNRYYSNGSLNEGSRGYYWSSTVGESHFAQRLLFYSSDALISSDYKANGYSIRCIKEITTTSNLSVSTAAVKSISATSAISGGVISSDGGDAIISRGVVWSTSQNPTIDFSTKTSNGSGIGSFISSITDLSPSTTYYVRAYATNNAGTVYGDQVSFTTTNASSVSTTTSLTGKVWMDMNLGASSVATSRTDNLAYGDLYQWGRGTDGHEKRTSLTTNTLCNSDKPGHDKFITTNSTPQDWRSPGNDNLWQGVNGNNNPCPEGFRIPTMAEWQTELYYWSSNNSAGAFTSPLKLTSAGGRSYNNGSIFDVGSIGYYWTSTINGTNAQCLSIISSNLSTFNSIRAFGRSVRCIKD